MINKSNTVFNTYQDKSTSNWSTWEWRTWAHKNSF